MTTSINSALLYTAKLLLKSLAVSAIIAAIGLRVFISPTDNDLPFALLCILLFGIQLIVSIIPGLLLSVIIQKTSAGAQKWAIWLAAILLIAVLCIAYTLFAGEPRGAASTIIHGVDDLVTLCFLGNVIGLSFFIWQQDLPAVSSLSTN